MNEDALFTKVRALLAKAESTPFEEEANSFIAKAQELITKYAIDEELLWAHDPAKRSPIQKIVITIKDGAHGAYGRRAIMNQIAINNNCKCWYVPGADTTYIAGYPADLTFSEMLFTSVQVQMNFALATALALADSPSRSFRKDFIAGWSSRICDRLREARKVVSTTTGSTELVLLDRKGKVDKWVADNVGVLSRGRNNAGTTRDYGAFGAGRSAADKADISGGRNTVGAAKRLGR